jgi:hypothetical protein
MSSVKSCLPRDASPEAVIMPASRVCHVTGCPRYQPCPEHKRGTTTQRGYGTDHRRARTVNERRMTERGYLTCVRCGGRIGQGEAWAQDHNEDRSGYLGPSHEICNARAAGIASTSRHG